MEPMRATRGPEGSAICRTAFLAAVALIAVFTLPCAAQEELGYWEYQSIVSAAERLDKMALVGSLEDDFGLYAVIGDRFGLVRINYLTHQSSEEIWSSKQLHGSVSEVLVADLDRDGDDEIIAWTGSGMVYVWDSESHKLLYESLTTDYETIHCLAVGRADDDPQLELVINADRKIHYIDGKHFTREWTSLNEYQATRMACGDVDGDRTMEIVLNNGQVIDARSGDVEWEDEVFGLRIVLVDIDGDGIPEIMTESDGSPMKIFDVDHRKEKHLQ